MVQLVGNQCRLQSLADVGGTHMAFVEAAGVQNLASLEAGVQFAGDGLVAQQSAGVGGTQLQWPLGTGIMGTASWWLDWSSPPLKSCPVQCT